MYLPPNRPVYSTIVNTAVSVVNRINPAFSVHYLEFLFGHMSSGCFHWFCNLPLNHIAELVRCNDVPPNWVPQSFLAEFRLLALSYSAEG